MNISMNGYFFIKSRGCCILIAVSFITIPCFSQYPMGRALPSLDPFTINSNGGSTYMSQMMMDWSLEDMSSTLAFKNKPVLLLSIGYLQNGYDVIPLYNPMEIFGLQIKVGPNPFKNNINIYCTQDGMDILGIQVYDSQGSLIKNITGPFSGLQFEQHIQVQKLSIPICFVQVNYIVANKYRLHKNFKLLQYSL